MEKSKEKISSNRKYKKSCRKGEFDAKVELNDPVVSTPEQEENNKKI